MELNISNWAECPFRMETGKGEPACVMSWHGSTTPKYFPAGECLLIKYLQPGSNNVCPSKYNIKSSDNLRGVEPMYCPLKKEKVILKALFL